MRLFTTIGICVAALLPAVLSAQSADYSLQIDNQSIAVGETIEVSWDTTTNSVSRDWIGLYQTNANDRNYLDWEYVDDTTGTLSFTPTQAGDYEFRYFLNNGYEKVAVSEGVVVTTPDVGAITYDLTLEETVYETGEKVTVSWDTNANSVSRDWIGLYQTSASDQRYLAWEYVTDTSGSISFTADQAGDYEFRYFLNNGYDRQARSDTITVKDTPEGTTDYTLETDVTTITPGEQITVSWDTDSNTTNRDWVGLYRTGAKDNRYLDWEYVDGNSGSFSFTLTQTGTYEFRYFLDNGYVLAATSNEFVVEPPQDGGDIPGYSLTPDQIRYDRGDVARVTWDVPANTGFFRNWIGQYRPGDADNQYIKFEYVDIFSRTETFRLDNDGTYEFRFFTNNSYNKVATSEQIIVSNDMNTSCSLNTAWINNFPAPNGPIVAFGDSITVGVGATAGEDYVSELEDRLGVPIINEGMSGDTTRDALARLDRDVLERDPAAVIVFLGGNDEIRRFYDKLSGTLAERNLQDELDDLASNLNYDWADVPLIPRSETFNNIQSIIEQIQATGAVTILVGFDATIYDSRIDDNYQQIARDTGSFYVADIYSGIFGRPRFMSDLVHPNDAGYDIVADRIQPAVACVL